MALTAAALTAPGHELEALKAIQHARYVKGKDITQLETLITVLKSLRLEQAATRLAQPDEDLLAANCARVAYAQALLGARGVPTFILETSGQRQLLYSSAAFFNPQAFVEQLTSA